MRYVLAALVLLAAPACARPVVVEMYTSQACSSCPPADALLAGLVKNPGILALSLNVTYWNNGAYTDPYGLKGATERQAWYASIANSQDVYTPEAVVDGTAQMVGSDAGKVAAAIANAKASPAGNAKITITGGPMITIAIGPGAGGAAIWLFGYDTAHTSHIGAGENAGATLTEVNVVRSISNLGTWTGLQTAMTISRPAGQHTAVILQTPAGAVVGAASE